MTSWLRDIRLVPIVLLAIGALFVLKTFGLFFDGGYSLGERMNPNKLTVTTVPVAQVAQLRSPSVPLDLSSTQSAPKLSWMQDVFNYPGGDVTGSIHGKPAEKKAEAPATAPAKPADPKEAAAGGGTPVPAEPRPTSPGERAVLERLQERRQELDSRARELDMREGMLKAAEKKIETQAAVEKAEAAQGGAANAAGAAAQRKDDPGDARFKAVITMYEAMKPKEAAKIFDRLDIKVLLDLASQIKPQVMSAIMAQMSPENAERLTVEMSVRNSGDRGMDNSRLPKIDGRPSGG
jgi:flagellar motility protein MotE (MotC chaperone)